jgi:hypothetical protein
MAVADATETAIEAADHLTDMDLGAVEMLRTLAAAADAIDENGLNPAGKLDNVTIPTYLRYCESLGLTPAGRAKLVEKKPEAKSGKLGRLSSVPKPA